MNLIGNDCTASFITRDLLKQGFENPFVWTRIMDETFIWLLENYENIDFWNYKITKDNRIGDPKCFFYVSYDEIHKVKYGHHRFDAKCNVPTKVGMDVRYERIWEYIADKYEKRLGRMKDDPIWVISSQFDNPNTIPKIVEIIKRKKYKAILFSNLKLDLGENVLVLGYDPKKPWPPFVMEGHHEKIKVFLNK